MCSNNHYISLVKIKGPGLKVLLAANLCALPLTRPVAVLLGRCHDGIDWGCKGVCHLLHHCLVVVTKALTDPCASFAIAPVNFSTTIIGRLHSRQVIFWKTNLFVLAIPTSWWGWWRRDLEGRSPRPPLELIIARILIATATNSMCTAKIRGVGKKKKNLFVCAIPTSW